ncbi:MAG: COR domain-containing protein [bacterium]
MASQGKDRIYETKLMIVGEPGAGKTTLMNKLFDRNFLVPNEKQESTLGINVQPNWEFSVDEKNNFKAHVWDFGGHHIQLMLHQFFLTPDCLYILLAEKRKELSNFDYWLNIINILGENSPVIVLFNEINFNSARSFIYDEKKYKELFPDLNLQKLDVNFSNISDGRFDFLINTMKEKIRSLEHIGKEVPSKWINIRRELEERKSKKHINIAEYFDICSSNGIDKEEGRFLILKYFHLLGIVLHFSEDENLCDILFLDPNWAVDAVYSVLANNNIQESNGLFEKADIDKIWERKGYNFEERVKLLQLILKDKFDLCYKIPGSNNKYIIPLLLSKIRPDFNWDNEANLQFRFQYPFMPKGIVSRLIVRMHEYIYKHNLWQEGVVLSKNGIFAQVIERITEKEGLKVIEIRIRGNLNNSKDFLTLIREEIKKIHKSSFPNLPYREMIPCICRECVTLTAPNFFEYGDIDKYIQKGKRKIDCHKSSEEVSIPKLIGSVFNPTEIDSRYKDIMDEDKNISIDVNSNTNIYIQQEQKQESTLTATQSQTLIQDVKNFQGLFKNLKEDILDEVDIEITDDKEKKRIQNELQNTEKAFSELEKVASKGEKEVNLSVRKRIEEFIDYFSNENSRVNKALRLISTSKKRLQDIGKGYNKFAPFFGLPSIPKILLE